MVYYGHTCQTLAQRFATHKGAYNTSTSKIIIAMGDAVILLVENFPCSSEDEAYAREAYFILNNECINKQIPGRNNNESCKNWRKNNKNIIKHYNKEYYEVNKVEHIKNVKEYQEVNKEKIK